VNRVFVKWFPFSIAFIELLTGFACLRPRTLVAVRVTGATSCDPIVP